MIEVLGADREVVAAAEERGAAAPVAIARVVVDGVAALRMDEGAGFEVGLQPGPPVVLHMVLHRRRQQVAEHVPDQKLVGDAPAQPIARRHRQHLAQPALVVLVAVLARDIGPIADLIVADPVQFADARELPVGACLRTRCEGARRPLDDFLWCEHHRGRSRRVGREQRLAVEPRRHGDGDGAATRDRSTGQEQARVGEAKPVAAGRHRPLVGVGLAIARIIGLDFAQQEAALLEHQQPSAGLVGQNVGRQQARDVEARFACRRRQLVRLH